MVEAAAMMAELLSRLSYKTVGPHPLDSWPLSNLEKGKGSNANVVVEGQGFRVKKDRRQ